MGDNGSSNISSSSSSEGLAPVLVNENGSRNKRKFRSDLSVDVTAARVSTMSLTEFPRYEKLEEELRNGLNELGSLMKSSGDATTDEDWEDPVACQLEELLTNNLFTTFCSAVKKIVQNGYTQEVAEWAVLNSPLFHGSKDAVSNIVEGALGLLNREKEFNTPKLSLFEGLQSLVDYTLLEMIYVLRDVRPGLTVAEAMWCLLISDLNLLNACLVEEEPEQPKSENPATTQNQSDDPKSPKPEKSVSGPAHQKESSSSGVQEVKGKFIPASSQGKGPSANNSKRDMLRQKTFQFEKNYKGRLTKGAFKAKVAAWGSMVLDNKSLKSQSGSSSSSKLTTSPGTNNNTSNNPPVKENSKSEKNPDPSQKPEETKVSEPPKKTTADYYSSIPFDEALKKYVPQDEKDESILMLIPLKGALEKELQSWSDWANDKIMQAARRLGKDKEELKTLRHEKEEIEKYKRDKQITEENNMKRLSEIQYALSNATKQIEMANRTIKHLELMNLKLRKEMELARLKALKSATELQTAVLREEEMIKKSQTWDAEKGLFLEKLTNVRRRIAELEGQVEKVKRRQDQFMVLLKQEEKEISKAATQIDSLRKKKQEEAALAKAEANTIRQAAAANRLKCEEHIKNLESMVSELRLESDKSKIAALNIGYGAGGDITNFLPGPKVTKRLAVFQDNFGGDDVKRERECVMCMTDEISVVFLPCAHQVLCGGCDDLHEKQGMNDCPSCRTTIEKRVSVTYRAD